MINKEELLFTVDESNQPIEPVSRQKAHAEGIWHRTVHIYVMNGNGEILVHLRSPLVDRHPNEWDTRFGGHVLAGKSYDQSAKDELSEELGLSTQKLIPIMVSKRDGGINKEFSKIYLLKFPTTIPPMKFQDGEVVETKWMLPENIVQAINNYPKQWVVSAEQFQETYQVLLNSKS